MLRFKRLFTKNSKQWSITNRLVCIYTLSVLCILVIITSTLYWVVAKRLHKESYLFLEKKIVILQKMQETEKNISKEEEIILEPPLYHYHARIINKSGKVLIETPKMNDYVPQQAFQNILPVAKPPFKLGYWQTS